MKIIAKLQDDQYPFTGVNHTREVVRAIIFNKDNKIALHKLYATDMFGFRDYYETPGGGLKEGETHEQGLKRELVEELGVTSEIVAPIGEIIDYYNLIKRENHNFYYIARVTGYVEKHFEEDEKILIQKTIWVSIDEAISLYENMQNELVGKLVKQRELPILKLVKEKMAK